MLSPSLWGIATGFQHDIEGTENIEHPRLHAFVWDLAKRHCGEHLGFALIAAMMAAPNAMRPLSCSLCSLKFDVKKKLVFSDLSHEHYYQRHVR